MLKFIFGLKNTKYTCACCGFKSLPTNGIGEICPICFWEEGYDSVEDLFGVSSLNHMMLYQAQENYKALGSCNTKKLKHCRRPLSHEKKDLNWHSIQDLIENKYNTSQLIHEIHKSCELLKQTDAERIYNNFKTLHEIEIVLKSDNLELYSIEAREDIPLNQFKHELQLKSFLSALCKKNNFNLLLILFYEYYHKGICYYISWSIMLFVLTNTKQLQLDSQIIEIFIDIETNNYYGLTSLESVLKEYWYKGVISENIKKNSLSYGVINQFIELYNGTQKQQIDFTWNGRHGSDFNDANLNFRRSIIEFVLLKLDTAPLVLIRDLYLAETQYAKEAWCVHACVSVFAKTLLMRGGLSEFDHYCNGLNCGWDAYLAARNIHLSAEINSLLANECQRRLLDPKFSEKQELYKELIKSFK